MIATSLNFPNANRSVAVVAQCNDHTLRIWPIMEATETTTNAKLISSGPKGGYSDARESVEPFTLGGCAGISCKPNFDLTRLDEVDFDMSLMIAVADGVSGSVVWNVEGGHLDCDVRGIDSRCATRIPCPIQNHCVAAVKLILLSDGRVRLACAYYDGSASIFDKADHGKGNYAGKWALVKVCESVPPHRSVSRNSPAQVLLTLCGDWLYVGLPGKGVVGWKIA